MKVILGGFVIVALLATAIVIGSRKTSTPLLPSPVQPVDPPAPPAPPVAPPMDRVYSASFVRGYNDGYSGIWVARWGVNEYRAGHVAGKQDRTLGKPNMFNK